MTIQFNDISEAISYLESAEENNLDNVVLKYNSVICEVRRAPLREGDNRVTIIRYNSEKGEIHHLEDPSGMILNCQSELEELANVCRIRNNFEFEITINNNYSPLAPYIGVSDYSLAREAQVA